MSYFPYDESWATDHDLERTPELTIRVHPHTGQWIRYFDGIPDDRSIRAALQALLTGKRADRLRDALANAERLSTVSAGDFDRLPPLSPIVEGVLQSSSVAMMFGASGSGKSALAVDLAMCVAMGEPWADRHVVQGNVLYVCGEGSAGLRQRIKVSEHALGIRLGHRLRCCFDSVNIASEQDVARLISEAFRQNARLVIIDTLSATIAGEADENSNKDMAKVIALMNDLASLTGATVLVIHHTGHGQDRERGASSLRNNVDTSIAVTQRGEECTWETVKQKDGEAHIGGRFKLVSTEGPGVGGEHVISIGVRHLGALNPGDPGAGKQRRRSPHQELILTSVRELTVRERLRAETAGSDFLGIRIIDVVAACHDKMAHINSKHRGTRIREAIEALTKRGDLEEQDGYLRPTHLA